MIYCRIVRKREKNMVWLKSARPIRSFIKELPFEFRMLLAFLHYPIAVVAAEVGEPAFWDAPDAVSFGGAEVFVIQPTLHRAKVISEKHCHLNVGQRVRFGSPFAEEEGSIFLDFLFRQISYPR